MPTTATSSLRSLYADDPILGPLLPVFLAELPGRNARLQVAADAFDWSTLRQEAHQLGGAAGTYGFIYLAELCRCLEELLQKPSATFDNKALSDLCGRITSLSLQLRTSSLT